MKTSQAEGQEASVAPSNALTVLGQKQRRYRLAQYLGGMLVIVAFLGYVALRTLEVSLSLDKSLAIGLIVVGILVSVYFSWKERKAMIDFYRNDL